MLDLGIFRLENLIFLTLFKPKKKKIYLFLNFQAEECALRACVDRFNSRRYNNASFHPDLEPVDSCVTSVLGKPLELTDEFKQHYEVWLEQEVIKMNVNWDLLLCKGYMG